MSYGEELTMVINKKAWLCGKCLRVYKTKHEAMRCETKCLNLQKAEIVIGVFQKMYDDLEGEKGTTGWRFMRGEIGRGISKARKLMEDSETN